MYSVAYNGNGSDGGTVPVDASSPYTAGATVTVLGPGDLTLTYWEFARWNTAANGSGTTFHQGATFAMAASNLTLYAQWRVASVPMGPGRRVGVAFDLGDTEGPFKPHPVWTYLDDASVFPAQFVSGYDIHVGRQTLLSQTDTGTATVYVNDRAGLFDGRNGPSAPNPSPYYGNLSGKQIRLQLWNPVTLVWEPQFRGWIDNYSYDIDAATDAQGNSINASVQLECVDMFDYLNGFGLTPGLAGQTPTPAGMEDGVYYAPTGGSVQDRLIEILTDADIPPEMRGPDDATEIAQGNVRVVGVKYDPDGSALAALRDAADAEFPFIATIYIDRRGRLQFHGRYARFAPGHGGDPGAPAGVSDEPGSHWDFWRWPVGDGVAIQADPDRAQMRVLSFSRARNAIINRAICYPQDIPGGDMPNQVYVSLVSTNAYGPHAAPPMSDLLTADTGLTSGFANAKQECFHFAKLLVKNQAFPREAITAIQLKAVRPTDSRAPATWATICGADIAHVLNVAAGYPGGFGFDGSSPADDYYVEGRALTVRPLNPIHDYAEIDYEVSPAVWSMDTHNVFPPFSGDAPIRADFNYSATAPGDFAFTDTSVPTRAEAVGVNALNSATVNVDSTALFPASGDFIMGGVSTAYTGKTGTSFTGCGNHAAAAVGEGITLEITTWAWDFGDSLGTDTVQNPTYTYATNGTFEVTLTVTDSGANTDDESRLVKVTGL